MHITGKPEGYQNELENMSPEKKNICIIQKGFQ